MAVLRRRNEKQFLSDIPTLISEEGIDSKYFQIFGIPEELPTGKSSFIVGGSPFLKSGVKLKIEILDSNGKVIYTEPVFGYRDGVNRRVSIEIYDSSQVGEAILTLLGEIDPSKSDVPIPIEWQGVYNVKYTRRLSINPTLLNVEPIRFHKQPYVNVVPLTNAFKEYIQQPEETRILTAELVSSKTAGTSAQTTDVVTQEQSYPEEDQAEKAFDFMSLYNSAAFRQSSFSNFRMPFTFQSFSPPTGNANLIVSSGSLDDGMIGKNIIINDPQVDTTSPGIPTSYTVPSQYSSSILDITNDTTANLAKAFYVTGDDGSTKYPVNLSTNQTFTCSFSPIPTEQDSVINYFDLADIRLSRLRTFSGDVKYVRVFAISQGAQTEQQFDLLGEFPLESQELLFDYDNIKSGRTGFFFNQTKIDNYWDSYGGTRATTATGSYGLSQTGSFIRYAMDISGSNADLNQEIMAQTSHSFSLSKNVPYELSFKVYGSRTPKTTSTGDGNKARIDFLISGSDFKPNHEFGGNYGRRILSIDFDDSEDYPELRDLQSYDWNKTYLSGMFIPLTSGLGKLQIRASSGRWHVADVSLRPAADTNFSPEIARIFSEMPPSRNRPETVKFLLEFVNNDGVKADAVIISPDVVFPGANFAIQGDNNVLSGSMFISNAVGEGIEMAGVGSAFLRTIGWEGFTSASSGTGKGGFFLYSGSVLSDSPDDYMGAGLEIHDGQSGSRERYFQFKTQHGASSESIFRVKTDDYLFGISGSGGVESYISGADGNLEVSSSNFSISNTGDVAMTGTITATAGNIGDWTISSGNIVGSNITMDADGSRIYKTDSNGELNGYYMDFTPGANYYVRFGTDFAVSSSGTLIASGAIIEGVITASEGYIANWTIAPNTINKLTSGTYTGMSSIGDARFFAGAANLNAGTSSAVFNVKSGGDVTGSQVLFTGGKVGGWTLTDTTLTGGVVTLNSAGSIEVGGLSDATTVATTNSGFFADSSGNVLIKGNVSGNDYLKVSAGGSIDIKSQVFDLATPTMLLDSGTNSGKISLGATPPTAYDSGTGIYIDGTGKLLIGNSGGDRIQFDGSNFTIQVGTLDINATDIEISSTQASASFGHDTDVGTLVIEGAPARITVVSGSISNTTFQGNTAAGGYHGEILKIGDITDNDGGDKFGLMMFDGKGIDVEDNRILSLGDRGNVIGGWEITKNQIRGIPDAGVGELYGTNEVKLILQSTGSLETSNFVSGLMGWRISSEGNGTAEFENMRIRGTLRTTVFEKESVNVVGGQLMVANSTTIQALKSGSFVIAGAASMSAASTTMSVENVSGFSRGEVLKVKSITDTGFSMEYMTVTGSMRYTESGSAISASLAGYDLTTIDPDGLYGEIYVGRAVGQGEVTKSIATTTSESISLLLDNGRPNLGAADIIYVNNTGSLLPQTVIEIDDERMKITAVTGSIPVLGPAGQAQSGSLYVIRDWHDTVPSIHNHGSSVSTVKVESEFLAGLVSTAQEYSEGQVIVSTGKFAQGTNFNDAFGYSANTSDAPNANGEYRLKSAAGAHLTTLPTITTATQLEIYNTDRDSTSRDNFYSLFDKGSYIVLLVDGTKEWVRFVVNGNPSKSGNVHTFPIKLNQDFYNAGASTSTTSLNVDFWFMSNIQDVSSGYLLMNANPNDLYSPYLDIVERTGSGVYDLQLRARLGDLSGLSSGYLYGDEEPGFGLYTDNGYFRGTIQAMTGSIHGILNIATTAGGIETGDKIMMGRNVQGSNDGIYIDSNNYWLTTGAWKVGGATNYLSLDNGSDGNISIKSETFELDASNLELSSTQASMSLGDGKIVLQGASAPFMTLNSGSTNEMILKTDGTDAFIGMGGKTGFATEGTGTAGILIGMDGSNPQAEFVRSATDYFLFDGSSGVDIKTGKLLISAGTMTIQANDSGQLFEVGGLSSATDTQDASTGVYIDSSGNFLAKAGGANSNYIKLDSTSTGSLEVRANSLDIQAGGVNIIGTSGTSGSNYIKIGGMTSATDTSNTGVWMDGGGGFGARTGPDDYIRFASSTLQMGSTAFTLKGGDTLLLDTNSIAFDTSDASSAAIGTGTGFFANTSGDFRAGSQTDYIKYSTGGGLDIKTAAVNISSSNIEVSTRAGGVIRMGRSGSYGAPVNMTHDGIFMSGSGEFSFQTGSTYIKSQGGALTMQSPNFALRADGTISASDAVFGGTVYATAGQIGTADNYWEISDEILQDKDEVIKLNSDDQNITLSTGAFYARIQNDMTPFTNLAGGAGVSAAKTVAAGSSGSYMFQSAPGNIASAATNTSDSSTWTNPVYMYPTSTTDIGQGSAVLGDGNTTDFTANKTYTVVVGIRANFDHALSPDTSDFSYSVQGTAQATYTLEMRDRLGNLLKSWGERSTQGLFLASEGGRNPQLSVTSTYTATVTLGTEQEVYFKLINPTLTTTCQEVRNWLTLPKANEYYDITTKAQISSYIINLTPSSNVVEVTPKGIQGVFVSDDTLETSPNTFFVLSGSTDQTMRIQGVSQFTGSLSIKHRGDLSLPNTVNISPGTSYADISAKNYNVQDGGAIYLKPATAYPKIAYVLAGSIHCIGFTTGTGGTDFQMGDSTDDGNFHADANIIAYSSTIASDIRLKDNIQPLNNNLDKVLQLSPSSFTWKVRDKQDDIGLIAQAVEVVIPEIVSDHDSIGKTKEFLSGDTHKTVDYAKLTTILIGAIQEQQTQIENLDKFAHEPQNYKEKCDEMEKRIIELEKKLEEL